ncbi:MAG TPA: hypothetical protein VHP99_16850, partial [Pyrinomonadaceae bacterium]|nr:hypothetical protein [Pyrinomonadaceae bacterium]
MRNRRGGFKQADNHLNSLSGRASILSADILCALADRLSAGIISQEFVDRTRERGWCVVDRQRRQLDQRIFFQQGARYCGKVVCVRAGNDANPLSCRLKHVLATVRNKAAAHEGNVG